VSSLSAATWSGEARVVAVSATDAALWSDTPVPPDTALRIDAGDALLLGEVAGCRQGEDGYAVYVHLKQIIPSLSELGRLVAAVMCETPREVGEAPAQQRARAAQSAG
jgi:hypothetical protein